MNVWTPDFRRDLQWIVGLPFENFTLQEAINRVRQAAKDKTRLFVSTPNLNFLIASQQDATFASSVVHSDLSLADGMPIIWLARLLGMPIRERVAGSSLFESLNESSTSEQQEPLRVFFCGGPEGAGQAASDALNSRKSGLRCVGYLSPGFGSVADMSTASIIDQINNSEADFLVVALGAKKGQAWIERNLQKLNPPVVSHLGAVINFAAGSIQRAPVLVQTIGLEWLWRVKEEPSLWKRYWNDGLSFLKLLITRAMPLTRLIRKMKAEGILDQSVQCSAKVIVDTLQLKWTGPLTHAKAGSLYEHFTTAQRQSLQVSLDLSRCTYVDCDAIPHIASFELSQRLALKKLHISSVSTSVAMIFKLSNVPFTFEAAE
jgi:N-acetylglucosaminyldiphosphoundecaprenol N-acetyl-beta-D-mannosaminyltransferase